MNVQLPHDYITNTTVFPHFHFSPNTTASGNVVFKTSYTWANMGQTFGTETVVTSLITIDGDNMKWKHLMVTAPTGGITPPSNGGSFSSMIMMRIERLGTDNQDTYEATIDMLEYDIHYLSQGIPVPFNP